MINTLKLLLEEKDALIKQLESAVQEKDNHIKKLEDDIKKSFLARIERWKLLAYSLIPNKDTGFCNCCGTAQNIYLRIGHHPECIHSDEKVDV